MDSHSRCGQAGHFIRAGEDGVAQSVHSAGDSGQLRQSATAVIAYPSRAGANARSAPGKSATHSVPRYAAGTAAGQPHARLFPLFQRYLQPTANQPAKPATNLRLATGAAQQQYEQPVSAWATRRWHHTDPVDDHMAARLPAVAHQRCAWRQRNDRRQLEPSGTFRWPASGAQFPARPAVEHRAARAVQR